MLKRILAAMAVTSLVVAMVLTVYWVRSVHGRTDEFSLGGNSDHQTHFMSAKSFVMIETQERSGSVIVSQIRPVAFRTLFGYCLVVPGFWLAIWVRSKLPRPGRGLAMRPDTRHRRGL